MTTCVRSRYGTIALKLAAFLGTPPRGLRYSVSLSLALAAPDPARGFACAPPVRLGPQSDKGCRWMHPSPHRMRPCAGISARRPSATPLGLALGPDSPWEDDPCPGNLSQMVEGIPTPHRYSRRHTRSRAVHRSSRCGFAPRGTLLYHFR